MRCGVAVARLLRSYGVDTVFGVPGVHTLEYYRGFAECGINAILVRHEQGAGFMADGFARATGRPGVACVITGPGVTNVATPMGQAYSDSIPMLVLASVNAGPRLGKGWGDLHETVDQLSIVRPLAGLAAGARVPEDIPAFLGRAFSGFASSRPRPAFLEVPIDVLAQETAGDWHTVTPAPPPSAQADRVCAAAAMVLEAQRPCIIVGGGASGGANDVRALAARLGVAVLCTIAGKGVVAASDPLCAGSVLALPASHTFLQDRDVILALGTELAETDFWGDNFSPNGRVIRVDIDPAQLSGQTNSALPILSDTASFCRALLEELERRETAAPIFSCGAHDAQMLRETVGARGVPDDDGRFAVLAAMRRALPPDARIFTDMTQIAYAANTVFPMEVPRHWFHPNGYGTLGYALPAAIGACVGDRVTRTVALAGDAGLLYTVQEMATAAELGLPVTAVLWNNDALAQIRDDMVRSHIPLISVVPTNPDYQGLARSFGWKTACPRTIQELENILAAEPDGPTFIEVRATRIIEGG
jgi:5-guanidino-2-oxopentanoate decarboxylase